MRSEPYQKAGKSAMEERLPLGKRPGDLLLAFYFFLHLPIAILIDGQTVFPKDWYPALLKEVVKYHVNTNGDYFVRDVPPFFRALVLCEFAIQLPLHVACGMLLSQEKSGEDWLASSMVYILPPLWFPYSVIFWNRRNPLDLLF